MAGDRLGLLERFEIEPRVEPRDRRMLNLTIVTS